MKIINFEFADFKRSGTEIERKRVQDGNIEVLNGKTGLFDIVFMKLDKVKFLTSNNETVVIYEKYYNNKLNERFLDNDYYITTAEYKKDFERNI